MRKSEIVVAGPIDANEADRLVVLLAAMGVEAKAVPERRRWFHVVVAAEDADHARAIVREQLEEDAADSGPQGIRHAPHRHEQDQRWFGPGTAAVAAVAAVCVLVYIGAYSGPDGGTRSKLLAYGAISWQRVEAGEIWRLATAVFLHFGLPHLAVNLVALFVLGPPLAREVGPRWFLVVFVATGVTGNVVSHYWSPMVGLKAGASGGIAGVLGALAGQSLRARRVGGRYRSWHVLGALAAIYGMLIGFGPGRDNAAHLGGLLAGLAIGRLIEPSRRVLWTSAPPEPRRPQA